MPFIRRLGLFLVGLSVGLIFLAIFLRHKSEETGTSFCYFPNCRVLKELRSKPLRYSDRIESLLENRSLDSLTIAGFLAEGDVDFGKSNTEAQPCPLYFIEGRYRQKEAVLQVQNCRDSIVIMAIE